MPADDLAQMLLQLFDRRVAFPLVSSRDDEDEGLGLGAGFKKFIDQARSEAETQATTRGSVKGVGRGKGGGSRTCLRL